MDVSLKEDSGLELVKDIRIRFPKMAVLILSMHDETFYAERFLRAGARGYIMKEVATEKLLIAIHRVLGGEVYLSERMSSRILHKLVDGGGATPAQATIDVLSDRELGVFSLIGQGLGTRDIAKRLHVSVKTVEAHRAHIKEKLNLQAPTELLPAGHPVVAGQPGDVAIEPWATGTFGQLRSPVHSPHFPPRPTSPW